MKRYLSWFCALSLLILSACVPAPAEEPAPPETEGPIELESLAVELRRDGVSAQDLARAARELPELLKAALADQGVEAGTVTVSVGSSPAAAVQAVSEGGVDLAFLPEAELAVLEEAPRRLLSAVPASGEAPDAMAVIVRPDDETLSGEAFAAALAAAVNGLREEQTVFGPYDYAWAGPEEGAAGA